MIELQSYPTGRTAWIDPDKVSAVIDLIEGRAPRIAGADPQLAIVGTQVIVDGCPVPIAGEAHLVAEAIKAARAPRFARLVS